MNTKSSSLFHFPHLDVDMVFFLLFEIYKFVIYSVCTKK